MVGEEMIWRRRQRPTRLWKRSSGGGVSRRALRCRAPEPVEFALRVEDLDGEGEDPDQIEEEPEPDADRCADGAADLLSAMDPLERAIGRDERRHQDQPAEGDRHQRRERASAQLFLLPGSAAKVTKLAVDLVV